MEQIKKYIPTGTKRRSGIKNLGVKFIVCHDTGNDGSTALQNVNYYINSANEMSASAHAFVDATGVIECIPLDEKAWHVQYQAPIDNQMFGYEANDCAIGVELCYSTKGVFDSKLAYQNYVEYVTSLLKKYNLGVDKLVGHYTLDPTRRTDPINAFTKIGKNWDTFIQDVKNLLFPTQNGETRAEIVKKIEELLKKLV